LGAAIKRKRFDHRDGDVRLYENGVSGSHGVPERRGSGTAILFEWNSHVLKDRYI